MSEPGPEWTFERVTQHRPVRIIYNPVSGGMIPEAEELRGLLNDLDPELVVTRGEDEAREAAGGWQSSLLVVAGGDGTVNQAIKGLGENGFPNDVTFAVLPMGTGNDLAQTLCIPPDPKRAAEMIRQERVRVLDAARIVSIRTGEVFFINVATGGLGMEISQAADDQELKSRWGRLSYLRASLEALGDRAARRIRVTLDGEGHELPAVSVTVANCRYAGGGWPAAPRANPEDGLLDVVVIKDATASTLTSLGPRALAKTDYLEDSSVFFGRASSLSVEADPGIGFTADGELIGEADEEPVGFAVIPQAIKVIVGPQYAAQPAR
ncbi:MAG: diacylglycerol/lipid kinase family protein [Rubrobacteraceae bacterium]